MLRCTTFWIICKSTLPIGVEFYSIITRCIKLYLQKLFLKLNYRECAPSKTQILALPKIDITQNDISTSVTSNSIRHQCQRRSWPWGRHSKPCIQGTISWQDTLWSGDRKRCSTWIFSSPENVVPPGDRFHCTCITWNWSAHTMRPYCRELADFSPQSPHL